jgi:hypothetical protein
LHLVLVHKVRRAKLDLKGSKEPQDHLDRQAPPAQQDQKATRDPKVLPVRPVHLVQRFV